MNNDVVKSVAHRLSLRPPQRHSLDVLHRVTQLVPLLKGGDLEAALNLIKNEFPSVSDFEREFPSICFSLATGVGKTRLMGAFISYLRIQHGIRNFFVLAPNLTIYKKLIDDFTPNTKKYVFDGIAEFKMDPPQVVTGDNYENLAGQMFDAVDNCRINIFNISKINSEVRGGKEPRIKRLREYIGESYFSHLSELPDLVLLMDESHRYRASAGLKAINELKPVLGLELTATPYIETPKGPVRFKNVIYDYPLGQAIEDGFLKSPTVATQRNFNAAAMSEAKIEEIKLYDGIRLHELTKAELETYSREYNRPFVKPFVLIIARDTTHAGNLLKLIESDDFFGGRYRGRVIQVDSSKSGAEEDEMITRLLNVEKPHDPTEIVIHVNMLKEGWDVTNLYTIIPLRAANARILIEQSIGRGLRLPYGERTGISAVDALTIVAHDNFQKIIEEANRPDSTIKLKTREFTSEELQKSSVSVVSRPNLHEQLDLIPDKVTDKTVIPTSGRQTLFQSERDKSVARRAFEAIQEFQNAVPSSAALRESAIQERIIREAGERFLSPEEDAATNREIIAKIVEKTTEAVIDNTIDIPLIRVVPVGEVRTGYKPFRLAPLPVKYAAPNPEMLRRFLGTNDEEIISFESHAQKFAPPIQAILDALREYDDVSYDDCAELLYSLAVQCADQLSAYLSENEVIQVANIYQQELADNIHRQMQEHYWEETSEFRVEVVRGFQSLKETGFTDVGSEIRDLSYVPEDKSRIQKEYYGNFSRCLYPVQKFDSDGERRLARILEKESLKWFRPAKGQFQIQYRVGAEMGEYQPDFAAETEKNFLILEVKRRKELEDPVVLAKRDAAVTWCEYASKHSLEHHGKPWLYALIPDTEINDTMALPYLVTRFRQ